MNSWVARFTPYDLSGSMTEFCSQFDKFCAHFETETKDGRPCEPHYHIYLETTKCKKTITNYLTEAFSVPKLTRGMANAYYMVKEAEFPMFQLGYVQKQHRHICSNIPKETLDEALMIYNERNVKPQNTIHRIPLEAAVAPLAPRQPRDDIEDQYLAYYAWMKKKIHDRIERNEPPPVGATWFKIKTLQYFNELSRDKGGVGLLPVAATRQRFSLSFYFEYLRKAEQVRSNTEYLKEMNM